VVLLFACCAVPVYSWTIFFFFRKLQGWLLYLKPWDIVGVFAYAQLSAFLESLVLLCVCIVLSLVLPAQLLRRRFVAQGTVMVFLTATLGVVLQYKSAIFSSPAISLLAVVLVLALNGMAYVLIRRHRRLEESLVAFAERLTVLAVIYGIGTLVSIGIVVFRNI
jgi:hypothetical protein